MFPEAKCCFIINGVITKHCSDGIEGSVGVVIGVNIPEIGLDHVLSALLVMGPVSHLILKGQNFIPPPSIHGGCVKNLVLASPSQS